MKSSLSIWQYVVAVKLTVKILSFFEAFLENINFNHNKLTLTQSIFVQIFCLSKLSNFRILSLSEIVDKGQNL